MQAAQAVAMEQASESNDSCEPSPRAARPSDSSGPHSPHSRSPFSAPQDGRSPFAAPLDGRSPFAAAQDDVMNVGLRCVSMTAQSVALRPGRCRRLAVLSSGGGRAVMGMSPLTFCECYVILGE